VLGHWDRERRLIIHSHYISLRVDFYELADSALEIVAALVLLEIILLRPRIVDNVYCVPVDGAEALRIKNS